MDRMWQIARTEKCNGTKLATAQLNVLNQALKVREELDGYHGRAALDVWNMEDVLSILSFNELAGGKAERERVRWMTKAIALVIELTCKVTHDGDLTAIQGEPKDALYQNFWRTLIEWGQLTKGDVPTVLTFNYDLVLERSLLHALVGQHYRNVRPFDYDVITLDYGTKDFGPISFAAKTAYWKDRQNPYSQGNPGNILEALNENDPPCKNLLKLKLLKLHGSVNFLRKSTGGDSRSEVDKLTKSLPEPLILPPVFNKATNTIGKDVWKNALQSLRECKNLIICGYSLPATDIYMQYFLKAALGPNQDLNHIYVFDPSLFNVGDPDCGRALQNRYASNFSNPIQRRISFHPNTSQVRNSDLHGTMSHLVTVLKTQPHELLFG